MRRANDVVLVDFVQTTFRSSKQADNFQFYDYSTLIGDNAGYDNLLLLSFTYLIDCFSFVFIFSVLSLIGF